MFTLKLLALFVLAIQFNLVHTWSLQLEDEISPQNDPPASSPSSPLSQTFTITPQLAPNVILLSGNVISGFSFQITPASSHTTQSGDYSLLLSTLKAVANTTDPYLAPNIDKVLVYHIATEKNSEASPSCYFVPIPTKLVFTHVHCQLIGPVDPETTLLGYIINSTILGSEKKLPPALRTELSRSHDWRPVAVTVKGYASSEPRLSEHKQLFTIEGMSQIFTLLLLVAKLARKNRFKV